MKVTFAELKNLGPGDTDWARFDAMTDEEAEANALADPDCQPGPGGWVPAAPSHIVRIRLGLTRQEFAARYNIPLRMIDDWEERHTEPDEAACAYLKVIAREPDMVARVLAETRPMAAE